MKLAKRWTTDEESRARWLKDVTGSQQSIAEIIARNRATDRKAMQKTARRSAHVARHGERSANEWY